jgi:O-antigen/teichoic acid export membrane protein
VLGIALLPLLVGRLGADATGLFIFATTLTGYFAAVEGGVATTVTKYVAEFRATGEPEELNSMLRGSLLMLVVTGLLVAAALMVFAIVAGEALFHETSVEHEAVPTLLVAAATAIAYWPSRLGLAALEGLERYDLSALIQIFGAVVTFVLLMWISAVSSSVPLMTAVFGAVLVLQGVIGAAVAWPSLGVRARLGKWVGSHMRPVMGFGGAMFIIGVSDTLVYSLDRTIVAAFVGASAIVAYEVGLRPQTGVRSVSSIVGAALLSTMSRLFAGGRTDKAHQLILIASFIAVLFTTPIAVLVMVLAKPFVAAWLGDEYVRYAVYAQIFTSSWLVHSNTSVLGSAVFGAGRLRIFVWLTVIGAVTTLALSVVLASQYGTVGVIWGTVIPAWIGVPIWMYYALRHVGLSPKAYFIAVVIPAYGPICLWTAAVVVALTVLTPSGYLGVACFGIVALALLWGPMYPVLRARWRRVISYQDAYDPLVEHSS